MFCKSDEGPEYRLRLVVEVEGEIDIEITRRRLYETSEVEDFVPKYRRWNQTSVDCYKRGCQCGTAPGQDECPMLKYCAMPHANFRLKKVVRRLVRELGVGRIETDLMYIEDEETEG